MMRWTHNTNLLNDIAIISFHPVQWLFMTSLSLTGRTICSSIMHTSSYTNCRLYKSITLHYLHIQNTQKRSEKYQINNTLKLWSIISNNLQSKCLQSTSKLENCWVMTRNINMLWMDQIKYICILIMVFTDKSECLRHLSLSQTLRVKYYTISFCLLQRFEFGLN